MAFSFSSLLDSLRIKPESKTPVVSIPTPSQIANKVQITGPPKPAIIQPIKTGVTAQGVINFAKDAVHSITQSGGSFALQILKPFGGPDVLATDTKLQDIIFGGPIKSIDSRVDEAVRAGQEFASKTKIKSLQNPKLTGPLAGLLVGGTIALDFTGLGGEEKTVAKIARLTKPEDIVKELVKIKVPSDMIPGLAKKLAIVTDEKTVSNILKNVAKQTTEKAAKISELATKERGFITSVKETFPELRVSGQYVPRSTDALAMRAANLIKTDIKTAEKIVREGTDDTAVATASELVKHYGEAARMAKDPAVVSALYDKAAEIATTIAPKLTEQGRAVQAASILGRMTPEGQLRFAARTIQKYNEAIDKSKGKLFGGILKKIPELTGDQAKIILEKAKKIEGMADGVDKAVAFHDLQKSITKLVPSPWYQKIIAVWKAGLLTGLKTSGLNEFANLFHGVSEQAKDIPAAAVDSVASLFSGKRTLALTGKGTFTGAKEGFQKGWQYVKTGFDERNIATKLDYNQINFGKNAFAKALQKYEETIFHIMGAEDQPFYYGAKARSLMSQAIAEAKNQGLKGPAAGQFVKKLVANPTDQMLKYAVDDAEISVFQNRTLLGDVARGVQNIPGGEIIVPFGRTPAAVATQLINYSPVGIIKTIVTNIGKGRFDQRLFAQGIGRGLTGTAVLWGGMELFKKGLVSLEYPTSEREQNQWKLEGRQANSIKIGGKWRTATTLGPLGNALLVGGYIQRGLDTTGSFSTALSQAALGGAKTLIDQTFLRGINSFVSAINDPQGYGPALFSNLAGSVIPTFVSDVARATDEQQRRTSPTKEGLFASLQGRIPGWRKELQPQVDVFGRPIQNTGNALETLLDPTRPSRIKSNDLIAELRKLSDAGYLSTPTTFAEDTKYTASLTSAQRTYIQELAGKILEEKLTTVIKLPQWHKADNEQKQKIIQDFTDKSRVIARADMLNQLVFGLKGKDLEQRLGELKAKGFLTKEVFQKWVELY